MNSLATLSTLVTTVSATFLIALKIVLVTQRSHMHHSYAKILEIVIESAALLSIVLLCITVVELASYVHPFDVSTSYGMALDHMAVYLLYCQGPTTVRIDHYIHYSLL